MIATNLVRDHWRKTGRERRAIRTLTAATPIDPACHPAQDVDVRALIAGLPRESAQRLPAALLRGLRRSARSPRCWGAPKERSRRTCTTRAPGSRQPSEMPVTDPRDQVDSWLDAEVEPLAPPPGAFDRISKRARRRKISRALVSAAGAVVLIAAAVALPRAAETLLHGGTSSTPSAAAAGPRPAAGGQPGQDPPAPRRRHAQRALGHARAAGHLGAVPRRFRHRRRRPTSSPPRSPSSAPRSARCSARRAIPAIATPRYCTSLAGTSDYGSSWYGVSAPRHRRAVRRHRGQPASLPQPPGRLGLRPRALGHPHRRCALEAGADGRAPGHRRWRRPGSRAFALFASCTGTTAAYAAHCDRFSLYSSASSGSRWRRVPRPDRRSHAAGRRDRPDGNVAAGRQHRLPARPVRPALQRAAHRSGLEPGRPGSHGARQARRRTGSRPAGCSPPGRSSCTSSPRRQPAARRAKRSTPPRTAARPGSRPGPCRPPG